MTYNISNDSLLPIVSILNFVLLLPVFSSLLFEAVISSSVEVNYFVYYNILCNGSDDMSRLLRVNSAKWKAKMSSLTHIH